MFRTVGMSKKRLIGTVLLDSLKYVLVSNIFAFPASFLCLKLASGIFTKFFNVEYVLYPTFEAIIVASIVGFLVPILSSFVPIQAALG
jgi:ABC-type antimicrobial peptide transport system permease subunit